MADFKKRLADLASEFGSSTEASDNKGSIVKFLRNFGELEEVFDKFSDKSIKEMLKNFPKVNKEIKNYIEKLAQEEGITKKIIDQKKQFIDFRDKELKQNAQDLLQRKKGLSEGLDLARLQKNVLQSNFQLQRQSLEQLERSFFKPMQNLLKTSNIVAYTSQLTSSGIKASGDIVKSFVGDMKAANRVVMAQLYGQVATTMVNAAQEFTEELFDEVISLPKKLAGAYKEGRDQYFERKREKIASKEEQATEHFDDAIKRYSAMLDSTEDKWEMMTKYGYNVFSKFDNVVNGNSGGASMPNTIAGTAGGAIGNAGTQAGVVKGSMGGAAFAGTVAVISEIVGVIGKLASSAFDKIKETIAVQMEILIERAKEQQKFRIGLTQEVGSSNASMERMIQKRDELFLKNRMPLDFEEIKEAYVGLVQVYGRMNTITEKQVEYSTMFNKVYKVSAEESAELFKMLNVSGFKSVKYIKDFAFNVEKFAKKEGVSGREVMRDIVKSTQWIALVGSKKMTEQFAKSVVELRKMGLHAESIMKIMDSFESFDSAIENIFQVNAALGTTLDPMRLHIMAMMGDVSGIQDELFNNLDLSNQLNVMQVKQLSKALGMTYEEVRAMEKGLHVRKEWQEVDAVAGKQLEAMLMTTENINKLKELGITNEKDQQDFVHNKLSELYANHKEEYSDFNQFIEDMGNPNSKRGKELRKEIGVKINDEDKQLSIEQTLGKMLSIEQDNKIKDENRALTNQDLIKSLNATMQELNKMFVQLLGWAVGVATPMLSGLLKFFGLWNTADVVDKVGGDIEKMILQSATDIDYQEGKLGLGGKNLFKEAGEKDFKDWSFINMLTGDKQDRKKKYLEEKYGKNSNQLLQETVNDYLDIDVLRKLKNEKMKKGDIDDSRLKHIIPFVNDYLSEREVLKQPKDVRNEIYRRFYNKDYGNFSPEQLKTLYEELQLNKKASGGYISGAGGERDDMIPAMLSNGEYVINAKTVRMMGKGFFDAINNNGVQGFKNGTGLSIDESKFSGLAPLKKKDDDSLITKIVRKTEEIKRREANFPVRGIPKSNNQYKEQAYNEVISEIQNRQNEARMNNPINRAINSVKALAAMPLQLLHGAGKGFISPLKIFGGGVDELFHTHIASGITDIENELNPNNVFGVNEEMLNRSGDSDIQGFGNVMNKAGRIYGGVKGFGKLEHGMQYGGHFGKGYTTAMSINLPSFINNIKEGEIQKAIATLGLEAAITKFDVSGSGKPILASMNMFEHAKHFGEEHKNGGLIGSFGGGTYANSPIPGTINTNDFSQIQTHPNETVSIMNQQQKIERDDLLTKVINMLANGMVTRTELKLNERAFGELITKVLFMESQSMQ